MFGYQTYNQTYRQTDRQMGRSQRLRLHHLIRRGHKSVIHTKEIIIRIGSYSRLLITDGFINSRFSLQYEQHGKQKLLMAYQSLLIMQ